MVRKQNKKKWLGREDSNLNSWNQNPESYHWTTSQCLFDSETIYKKRNIFLSLIAVCYSTSV